MIGVIGTALPVMPGDSPAGSIAATGTTPPDFATLVIARQLPGGTTTPVQAANLPAALPGTSAQGVRPASIPGHGVNMSSTGAQPVLATLTAVAETLAGTTTPGAPPPASTPLRQDQPAAASKAPVPVVAEPISEAAGHAGVPGQPIATPAPAARRPAPSAAAEPVATATPVTLPIPFARGPKAAGQQAPVPDSDDGLAADLLSGTGAEKAGEAPPAMLVPEPRTPSLPAATAPATARADQGTRPATPAMETIELAALAKTGAVETLPSGVPLTPGTTSAAPVFDVQGMVSVGEQLLNLRDDPAWVADLAREIVRAQGKQDDIRFRLMPQHLGRLDVSIRQGEDGLAVSVTAETAAAQAIIAAAQPRLSDELRSQGVKLAGGEPGLAQHGGGSPHDGQERNPRHGFQHFPGNSSQSVPPARRAIMPGAQGRYA